MIGDGLSLTLHTAPPPEKGRFLAVALKRYQREDFDLWHVALLYRAEDGTEVRKLDLSGDNELRDWSIDDERSGWPGGYAWMPLPYDENETAALVALCRAVGATVRTQGPQIRLGFTYEGGAFDPVRGTYTPVGSEYGLYCSTCVLALLKGVGIELLNRTSWELADTMTDEIGWFARQLKPFDASHAARIQGDVPCVVFHPREVVGGCHAGGYRVDFARATDHGTLIADQYEQQFPRDAEI